MEAQEKQEETRRDLQFMTHRVITMLERREIDYLDKLGKDALFSTGRKLSYSEILRWLINFAMDIGLSGEKIDSVKTFKEKMITRCKQILMPRFRQDDPPQARTEDHQTNRREEE